MSQTEDNKRINLENAENAESSRKISSEPEEEKEDSFPVIRETVKKRPVKIRRILQYAGMIIAGAVLFGIVAAYVFSRFLPVFGINGEETVEFAQDPTPTPTAPAASSAEVIPDTGLSSDTGNSLNEADPNSAGNGAESDPKTADGQDVPPGTENTGDESGKNGENTDGSAADSTEDSSSETAGETSDAQKAGDESEDILDANEIPPAPTPMPDPAAESAERIRQNRLLYSDLRMLSTETARAVVTVTGIKTTEDWFDTTDEERRQTMGVIVADNGVSYLVLAQYSALADATELYVTLYNNAIVECSLVKEEPNTGLGILRVQKRDIDASVRNDLKIAVLGNSYNIGNGEPVIAIGAPMGYAGAVDYGQITSIANRISVTDAAYPLLMTNIQGASTGSGVLINLDGEVIGIITQQYAVLSGGGTITALPVSPIKRMIEILSNNQKFAYVGITGEDVTTRIADSFGLPVGIYVTEVAPDSPAFTAGIQRGDILCRIGETSVTEMTMLGALLNNGMAGTGQTFVLQRLGADGYVEIEIEVEIGEI